MISLAVGEVQKNEANRTTLVQKYAASNYREAVPTNISGSSLNQALSGKQL